MSLPVTTQTSEVDVSRALNALDGEYICVNWGSRHVGPGIGVIVGITPAARRAVGMWPAAENVTDRLFAALDEHVENADPESRPKLIKIHDALSGTARAL